MIPLLSHDSFDCKPRSFILCSLCSLCTDLGSLSWDDLENDLPDELIPNGGDLGLLPSSNGGGAGGGTAGPGGGGAGSIMPDAAAKHKQLSELLRAGSSSGSSSLAGGLGAGNTPPGGGTLGGGQLGALGKSPLGHGSPSHSSPQPPKPGGGANAGVQATNNGGANGGANVAMGMNAGGFNQAMLNSGQAHGMLSQGAVGQQGQVMNGTLGSAGRGRGAMQYQAQASVGAAGAGGAAAGSVLAETLTQAALNAQQASNMNKVRVAVDLYSYLFKKPIFFFFIRFILFLLKGNGHYPNENLRLNFNECQTTVAKCVANSCLTFEWK